MADRRAGRLAVVLAAAAALVCASASVALARGGEEGTDLGSAHGLNYRVSQSDDFMGSGFNSFVSCVGNDSAVAGGVEMSGTGLQGRMGSSQPEPKGGGFAHAKGGGFAHGAGDWRSTATDLTQPQTDIGFYAVCKKSGADGLKYRTRTRSVKPAAEKTVKAPCPDGYQVIGGGLVSADPVVVGTVPFDSGDGNAKQDDGWKVRVVSDYGLKTDVDAIAVCLESGTWDLAYEDGGANHNIFLDPNSTLLFERPCDVGDSVIGGGGEILGPATNGRIHESYPGSVMPPDGGWSVGLTNMTASTVTGRAYAICRE